MQVSHETDLGEAVLGSLDDLLRVLDLESVGNDRFRSPAAGHEMFDRVFGGQLLAQAVLGAGATVDGKEIRSLHAGFVKAGMPGKALDVAVTRVRDGRSMATRQVSVLQDDEPLLVALASFHENTGTSDAGTAPPDTSAPEQTPSIQDWARESGEAGSRWIEPAPPVELRIPEPPGFLGGTGTNSIRSHWMRVPRSVGGDPLLNAALVAYASDFFLMDMVFRAHPAELGPGRAHGLSLDHAIWFHRSTQFDNWHLHTQEAVTIFGERGLARGSIHDDAGRLVATVMQEVLVRPLQVP